MMRRHTTPGAAASYNAAARAGYRHAARVVLAGVRP
jgi:hypothetical protein